MRKITELTAIVGADTDAADVFPIVDVSETDAVATKKITRAELAEALGTDQTTWNTGTATARNSIAPSELDTKIKTLTLGDGQTWQDVTASRTATTWYQNTTGRTIFVTAYYSTATPRNASVSPDGGTTVIDVGRMSSAAASTIAFPVPDGWSYRMADGAITGSFQTAELR